jgi:hypothetical protein
MHIREGVCMGGCAQTESCCYARAGHPTALELQPGPAPVACKLRSAVQMTTHPKQTDIHSTRTLEIDVCALQQRECHGMQRYPTHVLKMLLGLVVMPFCSFVSVCCAQDSCGSQGTGHQLPEPQLHSALLQPLPLSNDPSWALTRKKLLYAPRRAAAAEVLGSSLPEHQLRPALVSPTLFHRTRAGS